MLCRKQELWGAADSGVAPCSPGPEASTCKPPSRARPNTLVLPRTPISWHQGVGSWFQGQEAQPCPHCGILIRGSGRRDRAASFSPGTLEAAPGLSLASFWGGFGGCGRVRDTHLLSPGADENSGVWARVISWRQPRSGGMVHCPPVPIPTDREGVVWTQKSCLAPRRGLWLAAPPSRGLPGPPSMCMCSRHSEARWGFVYGVLWVL